MSLEALDTSYEPFSQQPEYIDLNRTFIGSLDLADRCRILDLACGTGTLTELILEAVAPPTDPARAAWITGLDLSRQSLCHARRRMQELGVMSGSPARSSVRPRVGLLEGSSESLPIATASMDAVTIGNAIQLFEDKPKAVREVWRVLRPAGLFAFNSSFYAGTYVTGTESFYRHWVEEAFGYLRRASEELKREGKPGIARKRGAAKAASSQIWLSRGEYEDLLRSGGFDVISVVERTVMLTQSSFESIGSYVGLATVLLSGYPPGLACEALEKAAGPALAASGMQSVPRLWIEVVARKRA